MALGVQNPNPITTRSGPSRSGGSRQGSTGTRSGQSFTTFSPTPEYSNQSAWDQWDSRNWRAPHGGLGFDTGKNILNEAATSLGHGTKPRDYYGNLYGKELVDQAIKSGMDPETFFALGPVAQQQAVQWGTNLPNAGSIIDQQRAAYDQQQARQQANNGYIDMFGAQDAYMGDLLQNQYDSGVGFADARRAMAEEQLTQGAYLDRAMLDQRQYRDVDLARADNSAGLLHNANMRGVLDERRGIRGDVFRNQQDYLNQQAGFINRAQDTAFNRFGTNDAYLGQQAKDLMAQYGFNARSYDQDIQSAFAQRNTQERGARSDAAARGAASSAGFRDNLSDIYGQYQRGVSAADLTLDRGNQAVDERDRAIGNDRANLRFNYADTVLGFDKDKASLDKAHKDNLTGYRDDLATFRGQYSANDYERARMQNVNKGLDSLAKEYGLKKQDIENQLKNAVDGLNLDYNEVVSQLGDALNSGNAQLAAQAMNFMRQMTAMQ